MKLYFQFDESGRVASYSDEKNQMPEKFQQIELEVSEEEYGKMRQNYYLWIRNNNLVLEKPQHIIDEEKTRTVDDYKKQLKEKLKDPKVEFKDVSDLLLQLLT